MSDTPLPHPDRSLVPRPPSPLPGPISIQSFPIGTSGNRREIQFWDYWRILVRHRWTIVAFLVASVIIGWVWTFTTRPVYRGTATLRIEKEEPRVLKFEEVVKSDPQPDYYQTLYRMLESRTLANRVITMLRLDTHPEFAPPEKEEGLEGLTASFQESLRERLVAWFPVAPPSVPERDAVRTGASVASGSEARSDDLVVESPLSGAFAGRLKIEPVRNARLVRVSFEAHDPELAARVPNALAEAFIASQLDQKIEATRYATQFLAKQMEEARERLEAAEQRLNNFVKRADIVFVSPERPGDRQDLVTQQLSSLSESLLKARAERLAKESVVNEAASQTAESVPAVLQSSVIAKLKEELATKQNEYTKLAEVFKPDYPRMKRLAQGIAETRGELRAEVARVIESLHTDYRSALRTEQEIDRAMQDQRQLARRLGDKMTDYNLLRREIDTSRELYSALLTRLKETQIASALVTSNTTILDRAEIPTSPVKPRKRLNLLLSTFVGLFGGVGLAFFLSYLDTTIRDAREVETVLRVPTLGLVPARALEGRREQRLRRNGPDTERASFALVTHDDAGSVVSESFRNLRTSLLYSSPDEPPRTIMVTSLQTEDGKTSVACNLAIAFAQLGTGDILIVDGDMRRPNLHEILGVDQAPGLSGFLTGQAEMADVIRPCGIPNLYVVPSGHIPINPAELMASRRLGQAMEALAERFSHIMFDTPPLLGVSDATILAPRVDGVVLVLRHGRASRDGAQRAVQALGAVHSRLLGIVLNRMNLRGVGYYGYHEYYGYQSGYGNDGPRPSA